MIYLVIENQQFRRNYFMKTTVQRAIDIVNNSMKATVNKTIDIVNNSMKATAQRAIEIVNYVIVQIRQLLFK